MPDGHLLEFRSRTGDRTAYRISVTGWIEGAHGLTGEDTIRGNTAEGKVGPGIDAYRYGGQQGEIGVSNPSAQIRINGKSWADATAYGARVDASLGSSGGSSGSGGGGAPSSGGASPDMAERVELAAGRDRPEDVTVLDSGRDLKNALESIPDNYDRNYRFALRDGVYDVPGAIQATLNPKRPEYNVVVVGNPKDPWACEVKANVNLIHSGKDEHARFEGMAWGRTQLVGPFFMRRMAFSDRHGKGRSSLGGKPAGGRFVDSVIGNPEEPDRYGCEFFGGGTIHLDGGTEINARDAAVRVANNVRIDIDRDVTFNAPKEIQDDSTVERTYIAGNRL